MGLLYGQLTAVEESGLAVVVGEGFGSVADLAVRAEIVWIVAVRVR